MARSKLHPVKRESSSEYFNKKTESWEDTDRKGKAVTNGKATNGVARETAKSAESVDGGKDGGAGVLQLVIAVAGIYASL